MIQKRIDLVTLLPKNSVVAEVGVATGRFSRELLERGVWKVFMVDFWGPIPGALGDGSQTKEWHNENYRQALKISEQFGDRAIPVKSLTVEAAKLFDDNFFDLIYLDADHHYEGCKADIEAYYPKLKSGGIFAGHDYENRADYTVYKAVDEFAAKIGVKVVVIPEDEPNNASFYFIRP